MLQLQLRELWIPWLLIRYTALVEPSAELYCSEAVLLSRTSSGQEVVLLSQMLACRLRSLLLGQVPDLGFAKIFSHFIAPDAKVASNLAEALDKRNLNVS